MSHLLNFSLSLPLCYSLKVTNHEMRENKIFYVWLLQPITLYWRRKKISSLEAITFLDTDPSIDNPYSQSSGIIIFLYKFYIVISYILIESWMCFSCCSLKNYHSFMRNQEEKVALQKKAHWRICVTAITILAACLPSYVFFFDYSDFTRKRNRSRTWWRGHIGVPNK